MPKLVNKVTGGEYVISDDELISIEKEHRRFLMAFFVSGRGRADEPDEIKALRRRNKKDNAPKKFKHNK